MLKKWSCCHDWTRGAVLSQYDTTISVLWERARESVIRVKYFNHLNPTFSTVLTDIVSSCCLLLCKPAFIAIYLFHCFVNSADEMGANDVFL